MRRALAAGSAIVILATGCGDDDQIGADIPDDEAAEPENSLTADEITEALLTPDDLDEWEAGLLDEPLFGPSGWREALAGRCDDAEADDEACEEILELLEQAEDGAATAFSTASVSPESTEGSEEPDLANLLQVAVWFPDQSGAEALSSALYERDLAMWEAASGVSVSQVDPPDGLGDEAWGWQAEPEPDRQGDDQPADPFEELSAMFHHDVVTFRRGRVVVGLWLMWSAEDVRLDPAELALLVDDRLSG